MGEHGVSMWKNQNKSVWLQLKVSSKPEVWPTGSFQTLNFKDDDFLFKQSLTSKDKRDLDFPVFENSKFRSSSKNTSSGQRCDKYLKVTYQWIKNSRAEQKFTKELKKRPRRWPYPSTISPHRPVQVKETNFLIIINWY